MKKGKKLNPLDIFLKKTDSLILKIITSSLIGIVFGLMLFFLMASPILYDYGQWIMFLYIGIIFIFIPFSLIYAIWKYIDKKVFAIRPLIILSTLALTFIVIFGMALGAMSGP
jgi:cation transport ATPase